MTLVYFILAAICSVVDVDCKFPADMEVAKRVAFVPSQ